MQVNCISNECNCKRSFRSKSRLNIFIKWTWRSRRSRRCNRKYKGISRKEPIVGICLGHQLLALTLGGKTTKLKFGHRGCNHPVKDLEENKVHITSQNHGYVVEITEDVVATHININDGTIEGMKHKELPIFSSIPSRSSSRTKR